MKTKYIGALLLTAITLLVACDDTTNTLGMDMLPDSDKMSAHTQTFNVTTCSYLANSVYAKTSTGYVGRFTDPDFGSYTSSFLTELNCTDNFKFSDIFKAFSNPFVISLLIRSSFSISSSWVFVFGSHSLKVS